MGLYAMSSYSERKATLAIAPTHIANPATCTSGLLLGAVSRITRRSGLD
jgi:hypothetical protein